MSRYGTATCDQRTSHALRRLEQHRWLASLVVTAAVLTACGDGDVAAVPDDGFPQGPGGVDARVGDVLLRDVSLDEPADASYEPGDVARLRVVLLNHAPVHDALTDVSTPVAADVRLLVDRDCDGAAERLGAIPLPAQPPLRRPDETPPDGPEPFYRVDLALDEGVRAGEVVPVTFTFAKAGSTTVQVPVELADQRNVDDDAECEPA